MENQLNFTKFCLSSTEQSAALTNQRFSLRLSFPSSSLSVNSSPDFSSVRYELFVSEDTHAIHVIRIAGLGPALIGYDDPSEIQSPSLYAPAHMLTGLGNSGAGANVGSESPSMGPMGLFCPPLLKFSE